MSAMPEHVIPYNPRKCPNVHDRTCIGSAIVPPSLHLRQLVVRLKTLHPDTSGETRVRGRPCEINELRPFCWFFWRP
jgi:hypothetical protein